MFGQLNGAQSSVLDLGLPATIREVYNVKDTVDDQTLYLSIHYDTDSDSIAIATNVDEDGDIDWIYLTSTQVIDLLNETNIGNSEPAPMEVGKNQKDIYFSPMFARSLLPCASNRKCCVHN